jgi:hypothetical protein
VIKLLFKDDLTSSHHQITSHDDKKRLSFDTLKQDLNGQEDTCLDKGKVDQGGNYQLHTKEVISIGTSLKYWAQLL